MSKVAELLRAGKALIDHPSKFVQGGAGDCRNTFCSVSAFYQAAANLKIPSMQVVEGYDLLKKNTGMDCVADYSDNHTYSEVMELWDKTISDAEKLYP